ncbi:hypothetical protein ElyMa_000487000 [Elysia marginata]|uniref:Uncharacterized protein n=1 Tax=Elysia marginata TaxID=1093978 RepID=A0AAV4FUY3_9GAST|nr:hypothetical protein ElyMa_000487000 [Elysia marginata]
MPCYRSLYDDISTDRQESCHVNGHFMMTSAPIARHHAMLSVLVNQIYKTPETGHVSSNQKYQVTRKSFFCLRTSNWYVRLNFNAYFV